MPTTRIKEFRRSSLMVKINDREVFMESIGYSHYYVQEN